MRVKGDVGHQRKPRMKTTGRLNRGILIAPLLPAFVLALGALGTYATFWSVVGYTLLFFIPCLIGTALAGFPLFYLLRRLNLIRWWSASVSGFIGGAVVFLAPAGARAFNLATLRSDWDELLLFSSLGGVTAFVVWLFWWLSTAQQGAKDCRAEDSAA